MKQVQITLINPEGKYKPISTIIEVPTLKEFNENKKTYQQKAIEKICAKRYWGTAELKKYGFTKVKCREYDKEKIARENAERYEAIKKERGWA